MTASIPTVPEVLNGAADLIDERGLATGTYEDDEGCLCVLGAIAVAAGLPAHAWIAVDLYEADELRRWRVASEARKVMNRRVRDGRRRGRTYRGVLHFSDTSSSDVVSQVLREAAEECAS